MAGCQEGSCKHHHSDLFQRAMILLMALTGNQGKFGGACGWRPGGASMASTR
ncbi:MAG: hypothetical protein JRS35_15285, partial [Deltaproteobacteria bacterium]|nr:hypothetical protein [Deltaproteobacteria bacterium]